jgi:hypothetical protein
VYGCIEVLRWSKPGIEERVLEVTKAAGWPELAAEALIALLDQLDASAADTDGAWISLLALGAGQVSVAVLPMWMGAPGTCFASLS